MTVTEIIGNSMKLLHELFPVALSARGSSFSSTLDGRSKGGVDESRLSRTP
jgi:hypothetical protein